ncbi:MAG: hypothetical protein ACTIC1_01650, partial [Brevibacterium sp.]
RSESRGRSSEGRRGSDRSRGGSGQRRGGSSERRDDSSSSGDESGKPRRNRQRRRTRNGKPVNRAQGGPSNSEPSAE